MFATTASMMSLPTQSIASGAKALSPRTTTIPTPYDGLVAHTIFRNGGMYRNAARRSRTGGSGSPRRLRGW